MAKQSQRNTVLVLGASGGIGGEVARQLRDRNWSVRALKRDLSAETRREGMDWLRGDALNRADVLAAAQGASVIVHAVNPPGYRDWERLVLPMIDNTIAAAEREGALVLLPGTIYNYGEATFPLVDEEAPQRPATKKGAIRVEMERRLEAFARRGGRVLIVRAGDFFGPRAGNSWFSQGMIKPKQAVGRVYRPGRTGVGHQWSYLPDVARTMVELIARREQLEPFARFHLGGHWDADGKQMAEAIQRVVARRQGRAPKISAFPWWLVRVAAPLVPTFREMLEMRYLWRQPARLDNARLARLLGREPLTDLDAAVEATLQGLGCFEAENAQSGQAAV